MERVKELGQQIIELSKNNQVYSSISNESLKNIYLSMTNQENEFNEIPNIPRNPNYQLEFPPQISQSSQSTHSLIPNNNNSNLYNQGMLNNNQIPSYMMTTTNIPFFYH